MGTVQLHTIAKDWFFSNVKDKKSGDVWPTMTVMLTHFGEHLLQQCSVLRLRELLVQMQNSLTADSENSDLIKAYRKKCKIDLEFVTRVIQLIDVFQPVA